MDLPSHVRKIEKKPPPFGRTVTPGRSSRSLRDFYYLDTATAINENGCAFIRLKNNGDKPGTESVLHRHGIARMCTSYTCVLPTYVSTRSHADTARTYHTPHHTHATHTRVARVENIEKAAANIFAAKRTASPRHFPVHVAR